MARRTGRVESPPPLPTLTDPYRLLPTLFFVTVVSGCALIPPPYTGPVSDHFDGRRFHNYGAGVNQQINDAIMQEIHRPEGRAFWNYWRETPRDVPPRRVGGGRLRVSFVNHATVLIQVDSLNILTDPIWSFRASPLSNHGPLRRQPPGIDWDSLPPIDIVLVSHNHYDHMDLHTLRKLERTFNPKIFVGLGNAKFLARHGIKGAQDIDWWQKVEIAPGIRVIGVPAQHYSQRWFHDRYRTLWLGFVIEGPSGKVYFAGDTGLGDFLHMIRERVGPPRLAVLPIGPGLPVRAMGPQHMSAGDAVEAYKMLGASAAFAMHYGTFQQGDDRQDEPVETLRAAIERAKPCKINFWAVRNGEAVEIPEQQPEAVPCR